MGRTGRKAVVAALALVVTGGVALIAAPGQQAQAQATYEVQPRAPEYLYARTCGYCHGHNVGPILLGRRLPAVVVASIVRSGNGAMPAFKPTEITNSELAALAAWIETSPATVTEHGQ